MVTPLEIWGPSNGDYRYFKIAPLPTPKKIYNDALHSTWPSTLGPHIKFVRWQLVATSYLNEYAMLW
jgi:hypothetical protein